MGFLGLLAIACGAPVPSPDDAAPTDTVRRSPLLVVGIDGADWSLLDTLLEQKQLPNLGRVLARGVGAELRARPPLISPPLWTTIASGRSPLEHGITWFQTEAPAGGLMPVSAAQRRVPAFWDVARDHGMKAGVIGWWATWPAEDVGGVMVSDRLLAHALAPQGSSGDQRFPGLVNPEERMDEFLELVPGDDFVPEEFAETLRPGVARAAGTPQAEDLISVLRDTVRRTEAYARMAKRLLADEDLDLTVVYFEGVDVVSHLFLEMQEPALASVDEALAERFSTTVADFYRYQDRLLGEIVEAAGEPLDLLIVSDHGFRSGAQRIERGGSRWQPADAPRDHLPLGVLLASGPAFRSATERLGGLELSQVAPLILETLGLPLEQGMDSSAGERLLTGDHRQRLPPQWVDRYPRREPPAVPTVEGHDDLGSRLEKIGYVASGASSSRSTLEVDLHRAIQLASAGDRRGAERIYRRLVESPDPRPALGLARDLLDPANGPWDEARRRETADLLQRARQLQGSEPELLELEGRWSVRNGDRSRAFEQAEAALALDPWWMPARRLLIDLQVDLGNFAGARAELEILAGQDPDSASVQLNLGHVLEQLEEPRAAWAAYSKAAELEPSRTDGWNALGLLAERGGQWSTAEQVYRRALAIDRGDATANLQLGVLLVNLGRDSEAIPLLEAAVADRPEHEVASAALRRARLAESGQ